MTVGPRLALEQHHIKRLVFVADRLAGDRLAGGAEAHDAELLNLLSALGWEIVLHRSGSLRASDVRAGAEHPWLLGNVANLPERMWRMVGEQAPGYVMYTHDHGYLRTRNPADYVGRWAPPDEVIREALYHGADLVVALTTRHAEQIERHLPGLTVRTITCGSMWSDDALATLASHMGRDKKDRAAVMDYPSSPLKGTGDAVTFARGMGWDVEMVAGTFEEVCAGLASSRRFVFLPRVTECTPRVAVEAALLGCELVLNDNVSVQYERWFNPGNPEGMLAHLRTGKAESARLVSEALEGCVSRQGEIEE